MWHLLRRSRKRALEHESMEALLDATNNLKQVQRRGREVNRVANALKDIRERNHFAEQLEAIILNPGGSLNHDPES